VLVMLFPRFNGWGIPCQPPSQPLGLLFIQVRLSMGGFRPFPFRKHSPQFSESYRISKPPNPIDLCHVSPILAWLCILPGFADGNNRTVRSRNVKPQFIASSGILCATPFRRFLRPRKSLQSAEIVFVTEQQF
ncbi:MAG TPA: hypothetical protein VHX68_17135, partial [Planctomycetaceae bacterium]|nr:hypothetical protein [Planctomycetaceae bacterium]